MYYIFAIIPKDKTLALQTFVVTSKKCKCNFIADYNCAIKNNNIVGRYRIIYNCGGLDAFHIVLLDDIDCEKNELSMHREYYKTNISIYVNISNLILNQN